MTRLPADIHLATRAVRSGLDSDSQYGAVVPPIHLSSTYTFAGFEQRRPYDYSRSANPTRDALGEALAQLEGGAGAVITGSGMSAINLVCQLLSPGDVLLAPHDCYGGTYRLFDALNTRGLLRTVFVDYHDPQALQQALTEQPKLIWVETPSNPLLRLTDIAAMKQLATAAGALLAVDNTFMSPVWQQPIALGADLVVHSTTKYLNGHSDVIGGAVVAADKALHDKLAWWANCTGVTGPAFDSYLTLRGIRTLSARMAIHAENADRLAHMLARHAGVAKVYFPGLPDHPEHALALKQQRAFGAMVSMELQGGVPQVRAFLENLTLFSLAESLGGVESLVAHPATMTHSALSEPVRQAAGISASLVRLSVGIEDWRDLQTDLQQALAHAAAAQ